MRTAGRIVGWRASRTGNVGFVPDALAETIKALFKAEVIHRRGPWRRFEAVEYTTLPCVNSGVSRKTPEFNNRRLLEPIGNAPPAKAEANVYATLKRSNMAA